MKKGFFAAIAIVAWLSLPVVPCFADSFPETLAKAEQGDASAQINLGFMYHDGQGAPRNYAEAMKWFRLADEHGEKTAAFHIGRMYEQGLGVSQDYVEAAKWYRKAAEVRFEDGARGLPPAQAALTTLYYKGQGVQKDIIESYKWLAIAVAQGEVIVTASTGQKETYQLYKLMLNTIEGEMTPAQIAEGQKRAAEW